MKSLLVTALTIILLWGCTSNFNEKNDVNLRQIHPVIHSQTIPIVQDSHDVNHYTVVAKTKPVKTIKYVTVVKRVSVQSKPLFACPAYIMPKNLPIPPQPIALTGTVLDAKHRYALLNDYVTSLKVYINTNRELQVVAYASYIANCKSEKILDAAIQKSHP